MLAAIEERERISGIKQVEARGLAPRALVGGAQLRAGARLHSDLSKATGVWTRSELEAYLATTDLSARNKRRQLENFDRDNKEFFDTCCEESYGCGFHVAEHLPASFTRDAVVRAVLRGGAKKKEKKGPGGFLGAPAGKHPLEGCTNFDTEKKCVPDVIGDDGTCIDSAGALGRSEKFSNGACYSPESFARLLERLDSDSPEDAHINTESIFEGLGLTEDDMALGRSLMGDDEKKVTTSLMQGCIDTFTRGLSARAADAERDAREAAEAEQKLTVATRAKRAGWMGAITGAVAGLVGAAAGAAGMTLAAPAVMAFIVGAAMTSATLRGMATTSGISLVTWVVKSPKTATMFLIVVRRFLKMLCREVALRALQSDYTLRERSGAAGAVADAASSAIGHASGWAGDLWGAHGGFAAILSGTLRGPAFEKLWDGAKGFIGSGLTTVVAGVIPGGTLVAGAITATASMVMDEAKDAVQFGAEVTAYQTQIGTAGTQIIEIIKMVLNPHHCVTSHRPNIRWAKCEELVVDAVGNALPREDAEKTCRRVGGARCTWTGQTCETSQALKDAEADQTWWGWGTGKTVHVAGERTHVAHGAPSLPEQALDPDADRRSPL